MRSAGHLLYDIMQRIREVIKAGETTAAIDAFADELIKRQPRHPQFLQLPRISQVHLRVP